MHLDGSIRLDSIIEIAQSENIELPSYTTEGLQELVFKDKYKNLEEYLKTFGYSCAVLQTAENLERVAYELALDNMSEGVRYIEVRFAPQLHMSKDLSMEDVLVAVNKGLNKAKQQINSAPAIQSGEEPPFNYGIIVSALRSFGPYSPYYADMIYSLQYSDPREIAALGSLELAKGAVAIRDKHNLPIVAIDLAGAEHGHPAKEHALAFQYAHDHFMAKTVHAGEAYGPSSIFQAITDLHADRIGHGYYLLDADKIEDPDVIDKEKYVEDLCNYIAEHRITIEVCLTSNIQTNPDLTDLSTHTFSEMMARDISVSLCTDNRTVSKTTVSDEYELALKHFDISPKKLKNLVTYGFKRSFFPGTYGEKRKYVRQCINYYEKIVKGTPFEA